MFDLVMWRMLFNIIFFNTCALRILNEKDNLFSWGVLAEGGYSSWFGDDPDDYLTVSLLLQSVLMSYQFWRSLYRSLCQPRYGVPTRFMRRGHAG